MAYATILNPLTKRKVKTIGTIGTQILDEYGAFVSGHPIRKGFSKIYDPVSKQNYPIKSAEGKSVLKKYVKFFYKERDKKYRCGVNPISQRCKAGEKHKRRRCSMNLITERCVYNNKYLTPEYRQKRILRRLENRRRPQRIKRDKRSVAGTKPRSSRRVVAVKRIPKPRSSRRRHVKSEFSDAESATF